MTSRTPRSAASSPARCGTCGTPLIKQLVEVLAVTADAQPIPAGADPQIRGPHRLTWCAPPNRAGTGPPRLRWIHTSTHPDPCPHPHHPDHQCTGRPAHPTTLF